MSAASGGTPVLDESQPHILGVTLRGRRGHRGFSADATTHRAGCLRSVPKRDSYSALTQSSAATPTK